MSYGYSSTKKFKSIFESPREPPAWAFLDHFSKTFNSLPVLLVSVSFGKESWNPLQGPVSEWISSMAMSPV